MKAGGLIAIGMVLMAASAVAEFRHVGDFLLRTHFKVTGEKVTPIPMKPLFFSVFTDGVNVMVSAGGDEESSTTYEIYRSDGIGRQRDGGGALEVIPGLQATSRTGGILRHLRLSGESLTITTFPGISDQTVVIHAVAAEPKENAVTGMPKPKNQP